MTFFFTLEVQTFVLSKSLKLLDNKNPLWQYNIYYNLHWFLVHWHFSLLISNGFIIFSFFNSCLFIILLSMILIYKINIVFSFVSNSCICSSQKSLFVFVFSNQISLSKRYRFVITEKIFWENEWSMMNSLKVPSKIRWKSAKNK